MVDFGSLVTTTLTSWRARNDGF